MDELYGRRVIVVGPVRLRPAVLYVDLKRGHLVRVADVVDGVVDEHFVVQFLERRLERRVVERGNVYVNTERLQLRLDDLSKVFHFWTPPSISSLVEKPLGNFDFASSALAFWRLYARTGVLGGVVLEAGREERASRRRRTEAGRVHERWPVDGVGDGPADVPVGELGQLFVHDEQVDLPGREELDGQRPELLRKEATLAGGTVSMMSTSPPWACRTRWLSLST